MHLASIRIRNYRRLRDVRIDLASDISIFVGANNSGKTSACNALKMFASALKERFSIHDFNAECWPAFNAFGIGAAGAVLPTISLDLWFQVQATDLHRVVDLLPSLTWRGSVVGLRVEFAAADITKLRAGFIDAHEAARASIPPAETGASYHPWPVGLRDYLDKHLHREFELRYYVLDRARFNDELIEAAGYTPQPLTVGEGKSGKEILNSLLRVDFLHAQRYLSDSAEGSRSEDLSHRFSRFYEQNLNKRATDYSALKALADSERHLDAHLQDVFQNTLTRISTLGYPGLANPRLLIKSDLNPAAIMSQDGARLHYELTKPREGAVTPTLPDQYNGLGFKNLIYMVVELLDLQKRWNDTEENRALIHLICIEEPEAHMHAQLQQVFIRKVLDILAIEGDDASRFKSQLLVTTHSPHILYERGFRPIRYFRRQVCGDMHTSEILNLSAYYDQMAGNPIRDFLERYMKLTHCDLFFADAAILVEGNVERLLLPEMIGKVAPRLQSTYCSILEIGGAFGFRFKSLIEFLGITTLIITDIDSVKPPAGGGTPTPATGGDEEEDAGTACMVSEPGAVTSNQTLIQWLPQRQTIVELLAATPEQRTQTRFGAGQALIRVVYQTPVPVTWAGRSAQLVGRTLEEAFALQNIALCQVPGAVDLGLAVRRNAEMTLEDLFLRIHKRIKGSAFKKTDYALALLAIDPATWQVPAYIAEGLRWLEREIAPPTLEVPTTTPATPTAATPTAATPTAATPTAATPS